jgi:hypothetical protein
LVVITTPPAPDPVAQVEHGELFSQLVTCESALDEELDRTAGVLEGAELELTERPMQHETSRHRDAVIGLLAGGQLGVTLVELGGKCRPLVTMRVATVGEHFGVLRPAGVDQPVLAGFGLVGHMEVTMLAEPSTRSPRRGELPRSGTGTPSTMSKATLSMRRTEPTRAATARTASRSRVSIGIIVSWEASFT